MEEKIIFRKNESVSHIVKRLLDSKIIQRNLLSLGLGREANDEDVKKYLVK